MNKRVEAFIEFLLDTETTSEVTFNQAILEKHEFYHVRYQSIFEKVVHQKLKLWQDVYQKDQRTITDRITNNAENEVSDSESDPERLSDDEETNTLQSSVQQKDQTPQPVIKPDTYIDSVGQCKRLLQFLYYCQQNYSHLVDLYFSTLGHCVKNENENIGAIALQKIALHLSNDIDDQKERQRLIKCLPSSTIPKAHEPILATIKSFLHINTTQQDLPLSNLDILYPYRARYLDLRREFRDSTHYFIDGDSLILSVAHHINIDLISYYGNTLHVIFIIERILLMLFNQTHQCNYTLLFFDCHHQFYQKEKSILTLLRTCLIVHLSKNSDKCGSSKVRQFTSWLDHEYVEFAYEEKPHFIFYHDMSSFDISKDHLLSETTLTNLLGIYRLFGNYHQYYLQCHLYLMNKLTLTDITVKCFHVEFTEKCPMGLLKRVTRILPTYQNRIVGDDNDWMEFKKINQNDVRIFLYLTTIMNLVEGNNIRPDKQKLFHLLTPILILHVSLLIRLSLIDRHLPSSFPSIDFSSMFSELIIQFQQQLALSVSSYSSSLPSSKLADLFDGRLFAFTLHQLNQSPSKICFDSNTNEIVKECLNLLKLSTNDDLFSNIIEQLIQLKHIIFSSSLSSKQPVLIGERHKMTRISNSFIDTYLEPILSTNDRYTFDFIAPEDSHSARYEGKYHWHVYKEVGDEISRVRDNDEQNRNSNKYRYRTKNQQKFYTYFTLYGRSLTSRDVRDSQLQVVLPVASTPAPINEEPIGDGLDSASTSDNKKKQKPKNQSKQVHQTKKEIIIEKNKQEKLDKSVINETDQMITVENLLKDISPGDYSKSIDLIDESLSKFKTPIHRLKLLKSKFRFQRKYLQSLKKKNNLTNEEQSKLDLLEIGYFSTMTEITHLENISDAFNEKKKYMEELVENSSLDQEKWYRFQLEKINSRLPRREQGIPDSRVADFIPDKWQVEFLNAVDKRQSVIIVAPTASGKTYASYYSMNKILKDRDDPNGICVYVAPTKALVNQVAATIHAKFGPVFGIFTRDYRMNMSACRILVTVPQCMEILLLSPTHQRWCQRIKYAIFDEIHCMSGESGSDVWGKTMLLINCPMIGLSATVNNGEELCQWIQHVENQRSKLFNTSKPRRVCYIVYNERIADLNKYLYTNRQLHPVHPVGLMNAKQLITRGVPKDFSLSPCETLHLNDAMKMITIDTKENDTESKPIPTLTQHFSPGWIIERSICNNYSRLVCDQFTRLIDKKETSTLNSIATSLKPITSGDIHYPESKPISLLIIDFIMTLKEKNLLPCIVFSDSRTLCEDMAGSVAEHFAAIERELRQTQYKIQIETLQNRLELIERTRKKVKPKKPVKSSKKRNNDEDNAADLEMMEDEDNKQILLSGHEQQLLNGILNEGTLANRHGCDRELVDSLLERASWENSRLVGYMQRGVAYHHAGLNNKGRVAVEALFRNRYVQVVFSTSTLSLGIHMPTKTVAFVKDSIYLDALQYRQSSGRAGRRGFDVQGHVVFVDIPLSKIRHLIISAIPNIHAHFPTSVTFLMRLLHLCSNAKDLHDAINRSLITLQCPLLAQLPNKYHLINLQTRFHCLFTLDFLYRLNLINGQGDLIGLAGLLTHLHYFEPANIFLVYLMDNRFFHTTKDRLEIMTTFAYLFTNMPWLIAQRKYEDLSALRRESKYNSKLFLPSLSEKFRKHVEVYNGIVKEVYGCYIENVTRCLRLRNDGHEESLPFSNISFTQNSDYDNGTFEYNLHHHKSQQIQNPSISPFAGLSGLTHERFMSNYNPTIGSWDLAYDLDLSPEVIPFIDIDSRDHTNTAYHLNSYALDFFKQGSETLLITENGLSPGDIYSRLLDIHLVLSSIKTSLEIIVKNDEKQTTTNDSHFFLPLFGSIFNVQDHFARNFSRQYPARNRI